MNQELQTIQDSQSLVGMTQGINSVAGNGIGLGVVLVVFVIIFYRLSPTGYIQSFTASSFTSTILAFMLASAQLMPVEMPFLFAAASVGGAAYMYMMQRP